jgi:hypothetical protein
MAFVITIDRLSCNDKMPGTQTAGCLSQANGFVSLCFVSWNLCGEGEWYGELFVES